MGFHVGIKEIIVSGGVTLCLLILLSIYSLALIWERWRFYNKSFADLPDFLQRLRHLLSNGQLAEAMNYARSYRGLANTAVMANFIGPVSREERKRSAQRAMEQALAQLQNRVTILGTIASVAPFIGLFGTVVGVMRAFKDLAATAGAGPGVVAIGISEALVCTATGLFVAIPAVAAYNYFNNRSSRFAEEMGWISDEILESLAERTRK